VWGGGGGVGVGGLGGVCGVGGGGGGGGVEARRSEETSARERARVWNTWAKFAEPDKELPREIRKGEGRSGRGGQAGSGPAPGKTRWRAKTTSYLTERRGI